MLKFLFLAGAFALMASPAFADPDKDESGKCSYRIWDRRDDDRHRDWRDWDDHGRYSYRIPRGHLPSPGRCRVWFDDRPAGHQPPPTSCRQAQRLAYRYGGRVIWGG